MTKLFGGAFDPPEPLRGAQLERVLRAGGLRAAFARPPLEVVRRRPGPLQYSRAEDDDRLAEFVFRLLDLIEEYAGDPAGQQDEGAW